VLQESVLRQQPVVLLVAQEVVVIAVALAAPRRSRRDGDGGMGGRMGGVQTGEHGVLAHAGRPRYYHQQRRFGRFFSHFCPF